MGDPGEIEPRALADDVLLLPIEDAFAREVGIAAQGYALIAGDRALLVDTTSAHNLPALRRLRDAGRRPVALALTHRDVIAPSQARIAEELGIPVLLHPVEAAYPRSAQGGTPYEDPMDHPALAAVGVEALFFPGHSAGHVVYYTRAHGGTLFSGDAAMGPTEVQLRAGVDVLIRPPASLNFDDEALRRGWVAWGRPLASVLPVHGGVFFERGADLPRILAPLSAPEQTPDFPR